MTSNEVKKAIETFDTTELREIKFRIEEEIKTRQKRFKKAMKQEDN